MKRVTVILYALILTTTLLGCVEAWDSPTNRVTGNVESSGIVGSGVISDTNSEQVDTQPDGSTNNDTDPNQHNHNHTESTPTVGKEQKEAALNEFLTGVGVNPNSLDESVELDSGGNLVGDLAKRVTQYKSLADAEEAMGFYLGLHNEIESQPQFSLVGMYNIGNGAWYQSIFEDSTGKSSDITVKVSNTLSLEELKVPYKENNYKSVSTVTINGVEVTFESNDEKQCNLVYFEIPNGRVYSMFTSIGNERSIMEDIATELVYNLQIMDDWVN